MVNKVSILNVVIIYYKQYCIIVCIADSAKDVT